jgi:hypothetical protein
MFIPLLESMGKMTGATVQMQQEMVKKWFSLWPGFAVSGYPSEPDIQRFQKQWAEVIQEALKRQREVAEAQFKAGLQIIETSFKMGEIKTPEELRARTIELWRTCIEAVQQASEAQMRGFTAAFEKWVELMTPAEPVS